MAGSRPQFFTLDQDHPLAKGLVFAGLGCAPGSSKYNDSSGKGNDGQLTNMAPSQDWVWSQELRRCAQYFDGSSHAIINAAPSFSVAFPFSFACWAKIRTAYRSAASGRTYFVQCSLYGGSATSIFSLATDYSTSADKLYYLQDNNVRISTTTFLVDTWQHFALSFDSATAVRLWINGEPGVITQPVSNFTVGAARMFLGGLDGTAAFCPCSLSDVVAYTSRLETPLVRILANRSDPMLGGLIRPIGSESNIYDREGIR